MKHYFVAFLALMALNCAKEEKCVDTQVCEEITELNRVGWHRMNWRDANNNVLHESIRSNFGTKSYETWSFVKDIECDPNLLLRLKDGALINLGEYKFSYRSNNCNVVKDGNGQDWVIAELIYIKNNDCHYECK